MSDECKEKHQEPKVQIDPQEILKRIMFQTSKLEWVNFAQRTPESDRWIVIWCNLGRLSPNLFITYKDATGNYEMPHPTKQYPARAWAYIDIPLVDEKDLEKVKKQLIEDANKAHEEDNKG
jgi:hypothetical protein